MPKIFNIGASNNFVEEVAAKFLAEYEIRPLALAEVLFLLPNRRACKALADAFVKLKGMSPMLLPQMLPVGDVEEDELLLTGANLDAAMEQLPPEIDANERLMIFIKLVMAKQNDLGLEKMSLSQACYLAQDLAGLVDVVNNENLDFANLGKLVPEEYASHWQETLEFLKIITNFWPQILQERGVVDPSWRRNKLLSLQSMIWQANPPVKRIIAAGTTATFPAMKELVKTVLGMPRGEVILSGLDKYLDETSWGEIDETHPQFELKELLDYLQIERVEVADFVTPGNAKREEMISELMRPAKTTDKWREIATGQFDRETLDGLSLINCSDMRQEALAVALLMRETLEHPEKTAALVTADRNLARRVAAELERWDIKVDDSAGRPLGLTSVGAYLRMVAQICANDFSKADFLSLMKHPLAANGQNYAAVRQRVRDLEKIVWRGGAENEKAENLLQEVKETLRNFYELFQQPQADFKLLICQHIKAAEALARNDKQEGEQILWKGDAGEAAANFIAAMYEKAEVLGSIDVSEYLGLFEAMMAKATVRPKFGTHPRLKILGPIEARLTHFDVMIIGGVNEGVWPKQAGSDPWMSRPMKKDFGFPLPEKAVGVMGLDFSLLLGAKEVYLTRSERVQGTPMVKSRWWMRLETILKAAGIKAESLEDLIYKIIAKQLDRPQSFSKINPPAPCPPVSARPRQMSASAVEMWMRDPYAVFAKYILRLKPLDEVEQDLTYADYGSIIHKILEEFNNQYSGSFPENAKEILLAMGRRAFEENELALERRAFWWPNFEKTVDWLAEKEQEYRLDIEKVYNEAEGQFAFEAPAGEFVLKAKADRVDVNKDGKINIIDYKTGKARSPKEVKNGYAPQLPIEGLIARAGGFERIKAAEVEKLIYWQLAKKETVIDGEMDSLLDQTLDKIKALAALFDFETTPYICQPNPNKIPEYSDYEHLARVKEWSVSGEEGDD